MGWSRRPGSRGLDVTIDNDMHTDLAPRLSGALPQYLHEMTKEDLLAHAADPKNRARIRRAIVEDKLPAFGSACSSTGRSTAYS